MYCFWAIVISLGIGSRLISLIQDIRYREWQHVSTDTDNRHVRHKRGVNSSVKALLKRYVTIPATFNNRCSQPFGWCTIPTRIQSLTIFSFAVLNIVLCSISYPLTDGNLYWPTHRAQLLRYVSDRTGIISLINFPLIWLFGMRNNTLMWMTGWGFGTYNNFHRWVARISTIQAVIHSIGWTLMVSEGKTINPPQRYLIKTFIRWWFYQLHEVSSQALLLEWRTSDYLHVCSSCFLSVWPPAQSLRDLPHTPHRFLSLRPLDHVLVCSIMQDSFVIY